MATKSSEKSGTGTTKNQQVPLTAQERANLKKLVARYQEAVVTRNLKFNETNNANVQPPDIMRAGLLALMEATNEKLRLFVERVRTGRHSTRKES